MTCLVLGGCTAVYDSQYDDRATELEEARREVFPAESDVQLIASRGDRFFWVDRIKPRDENVLHMVTPPDFENVVDYEWSRGENNVLEFEFGTEMVAHCSFTTIAFDPEQPNTELGRATNGTDNCSADGRSIYFLFGRRIDIWNASPTNMMPTELVNFDMIPDGPSSTVDGFAVEGDRMVFTESGGDIYTLDIGTCATSICDVDWLENEAQVLPTNIFFDDKRVMFDTVNSDGPHFIEFATKKETSFTKAVADGGYHLNFKHGDIQEPTSTEFVISGDFAIYRGLHGIFAYDFVNGKVSDILLDRGDVSDPEIKYRRPVVTTEGFMYVESEHGFGETGPVYEVNLNDRLGGSVKSKPGSRARRLGR